VKLYYEYENVFRRFVIHHPVASARIIAYGVLVAFIVVAVSFVKG
jgi:hypothetical protein